MPACAYLSAALAWLQASGVAELAERDCAMAGLLAEGIGAIPGAGVLNEVELNQVLVSLKDSGDSLTTPTREPAWHSSMRAASPFRRAPSSADDRLLGSRGQLDDRRGRRRRRDRGARRGACRLNGRHLQQRAGRPAQAASSRIST